MIFASKRPLAFITSTDFRRKPVVAPLLARIGGATVSRGQPSRTLRQVDELADLVRAGKRLAVFPEGSIGASAGVRRPQRGVFLVAGSTGFDTVPVAICGTRNAVAAGSCLPRRAEVKAVVCEVAHAPGRDFAASAEVAKRVRAHAGGSGRRALVERG